MSWLVLVILIRKILTTMLTSKLVDLVAKQMREI